MATDVSEEELQAFIGPNRDYYLDRWEDRDGDRQGVRKFHWAAFFFSLPWLLYRKLYRYAGLVAGIYASELILEALIFEGWLGFEEAPRSVFGVVLLVVGEARWNKHHRDPDRNADLAVPSGSSNSRRARSCCIGRG